MCFRPADASAGSGINKCPECGKTIQMMGGVTLEQLPVLQVRLHSVSGRHQAAASNGPRRPCRPRGSRRPCRSCRPCGSQAADRLIVLHVVEAE